MLLFCPSCSNTLLITPLPAAHLTPDQSRDNQAGTHRFQCRTCPYQMLLDQPFFERKTFSQKGVEEVLGGEGSWRNVDRTEGMFSSFVLFCLCGGVGRRGMREGKGQG